MPGRLRTGLPRADRTLRVLLGTAWIAGRVGTEARGWYARSRYGRFFERHPLLARALALSALAWGAVYLTWRIGWTGAGANPITFALLLVTELYGIWALGTLTWLSWARRPAVRPPIVSRPSVDVYVCTYDEPEEVVLATLAGCRALRYPHTTYLLDDGRRERMRELAELTGTRYLTRPDNAHAKAGNINAALPHTDGDLIFMLDADHVPMPDALDALVGYFEDPHIGLVQSPHDFSNQDSVQHYAVGRHEQSLFYHVICPGKGPPRRGLLVRLGGADPPPGAAGDRRRRDRDDRGGLPHDDPPAAPRLGFALPRRGARPGARAARPRRLPAAARPLVAREPRRLHAAGVAAARARAQAAAAPLLLRQSRLLPCPADAAAAARHARARAVGRLAADAHRRARPARAVAAGARAQPRRRLRAGARLIYRFEGDAPALCLTPGGSVPGRLLDANAAGLGLRLTAPIEAGARVPIRLQLEDSEGEARDVHVVADRAARAARDGCSARGSSSLSRRRASR
jgi:hypothetical protein